MHLLGDMTKLGLGGKVDFGGGGPLVSARGGCQAEGKPGDFPRGESAESTPGNRLAERARGGAGRADQGVLETH